MRKIFFLILILSFFKSNGQVLQLDKTYGREMYILATDSLFSVPTDTFSVPSAYQNYAFIARKNLSLYFWNTITHVWAGFSASGIDTTSLSNRINQKVNISDTATMLLPYITDFEANAIFALAARAISTGTGLAGGGNLTADRTLRVDTSVIATKGALNKVKDSVQTNVNLKADKTITFTAGTGIGPGLGDLSANRTVNADTSVLLTKKAGVKMRDSVQTNVNAKLNITDTVNIRFRPFAGTNITLSGTYPNITISSSGGGGGGSSDSTLQQVTDNGDSTTNRLVSNDTLKGDFVYVHGKTTFGDSVRSNKSAIFIGHSVVANVGVSHPWEGFPWKTADLFGLTLVNKGIAGTTVRHHSAGDSCFLDRLYTIPNYSGAPIFIMYDINDANASYGFDTTGYKTDYGKCIDTLLISRGYPNNKVVLLSANYVDTSVTNNYDNIRHFVRASRTVAEQKSIAYVDLFYSMERAGGSYYLSDEDHPNYKGTSFISGKIAKDYTAVKQVGDVLVNGGFNSQDTARFVAPVRIGSNDTVTVDGIVPELMVTARTYLGSKVYFNTRYDFGENAWVNILAQTNKPGIYIKDGNPYTSSIYAGNLTQTSFGSTSSYHGKGITTDATNGFNLVGSGGNSYFFLENDHSVFGNSNIGHADLDSTHKVKGSFHVTSGVRFSGIPSAVGTKALRYNPSTGTISYADTTTGGGGGGLSDPGSNGILARTALNTTVSRTITGTTGQVVVSNGDGVSANPTLSIDTAKIATKLAVDKARDSVQVNVNTKAASSITLNAGTGIDGTGLGNLTANRTINIDTSKMLTKLAAVKLRDSVQTNVNTKLNISDTVNTRTRVLAGTNVTITGTFPNMVINASGGGGSSLDFNDNHFDSTAASVISLDTINGPMSSATGNGYMKSIDYKRSFTAQTISNPTGTWTFDVNAGGQGDVSLTSTGGRTLAFSNIRTGDICLFRFNNTSGSTIVLTLPSNSFLDGTSAASLTIPTGRSIFSLSGYDGTNSFFASSSGTYATSSNNLSFFSATTTKQLSGVLTEDTTGTMMPGQIAVVLSDFTLSAALGVQTAFPSTQDVWTLAGSTTYEVEGHYFMTTGTTTTKTTAIAFALAGGATVTTINLHVLGSNNTANTAATAQGSLPMTQVASTVVTATATTAGVDIFFKGIIITNARGTWTPQINFSANPGGTNLMKAGSYISFTKVGTSSNATSGNVN